MATTTNKTVSADDRNLFRTLINLWPYMWPSDRPDLKMRVVWASVFLLASKVVLLLVPYFFKWATDALSGKADAVARPVFIGPSLKYDFRVYNRWGQLIFRSATPGIGWDGTFRSKPQPKDVYVFYVTAEGGCNGRFEQKGTFVLIR